MSRLSSSSSCAAKDAFRSWPASEPRSRLVSELTPYARNARTHSLAQVNQIAESIRRWGWTMPVLVRAETGDIIAGHGRILAAEQLGILEVPTVEASGWSDAEVRAYIIADNKIALNAGWDGELLAAELGDLKEFGFDLDVIGFSTEEMNALDPNRGGTTEPDGVPELGSTPVSKLGDIWICGQHRVVCGDSTTLEVVEGAMGGALADACWTDPPYNVDYKGAAGGILNDALGDDEFVSLLLAAFVSAITCMKPGAAIYVAHADREGLAFRAAFKSAGFNLSSCLIWRKNALVLGRSDYQWQHEPILYGWKPGKHRWFGGRKVTTITDLSGTVFGLNNDGSITVRVGQESLIINGTDLTARAIEPSVIEVDRPRTNSDHPTMKPVELIARMLRNSTCDGDVVLDLFGGSGSTLIACETLGRRARLVELDSRFVDVIVQRWQDFTGHVAMLEGTKQTFAEVAAHRA